jgi:hypothetical protein
MPAEVTPSHCLVAIVLTVDIERIVPPYTPALVRMIVGSR